MMVDAFWACGRLNLPLPNYGRVVRHSGAIRWVSSKLDWIVGFSSLIVCAQCVSRDWLAIEKDCLYRVIR